MKLTNSSSFHQLFIKKLYLFIFLFTGLLLLAHSSYSSELYFLCGPDEDGCYEGIYQYCTCTPYNDIEANNLYCFDFDNLTCTPLSQTPNCAPSLIYRNQGECLATIFQSEATPPCTIKTHSFCMEHHTSICDPNGQPDSCH
jgi:hypothetical protein